MARYTVEHNYVRVLGRIWLPPVIAAVEYPLTAHDLAQLRDDAGEITRDDLDCWVSTHAGDFQHVIDFSASIGDTEYPWAEEESELAYNDCMYPQEE
jgi:hypothetical protein